MDVQLYRGKIDEYDMFASNISILAEEELITDELYQYLRECQKDLRNVSIGILLKSAKVYDKDLITILDEKVKEFVNSFIKRNKIPDESILEIAKDAVFTHNVIARTTIIGKYIKFRRKETYVAMLSFPISDNNSNKIKLYMKFDYPKCKGSRINKEHPAYVELCKILNAIVDRNTKVYNRAIAEFKKKIENTDSIIKNVDNEYLVKVFKELDIS